ncbi:MAG TPA: hypothetical protein VFH47_06540, partial [Candidatus Thermoplasmatota archaeon]|nr:hypothetical protein [Candidatus Thermoplasmatota archaeon]
MMHARLALTPALVLALVLAPIAGAQAPEWTELGTDPAGDNGPTSAAVGVTDILGGAIAVADGELLVRFDLAANSAPAGSYCWAFGFQKGN